MNFVSFVDVAENQRIEVQLPPNFCFNINTSV